MALKIRTPSSSVMLHISSLQGKIVDTSQDFCMICPLAKQSRLKFPKSVIKSTGIFQLVHVDVWGPFKVPTYDRKLYFVTIVDDFSRYTWVCLINLNVR